MKEWEIEKVCTDIACRYGLTLYEYNELVKASIEEKERIHKYYGKTN